MIDKVINVGDVCAYFYDNQNTSFSIVEVVEELSGEVVVVKFHQVLRDDSGNDLFNYLCASGKTMNVSRKYLHKLDLINRQKSDIQNLNIELQAMRGAANSYKRENEKLKEPQVHMVRMCARGSGKTLGMYRFIYENGMYDFVNMLKSKMVAKHKNIDGFCVYECDDGLIDKVIKELKEELR